MPQQGIIWNNVDQVPWCLISLWHLRGLILFAPSMQLKLIQNYIAIHLINIITTSLLWNSLHDLSEMLSAFYFPLCEENQLVIPLDDSPWSLNYITYIIIFVKLSSLAAAEVVKWQFCEIFIISCSRSCQMLQPVMEISSKWQHFHFSVHIKKKT